MHVLGKPVGRHIVAEPGLLRLAVDQGPRSGELEAEPDIVDETGHLGIGFAAVDTAGHEVRQGGELLEVDLLRELPAAALYLSSMTTPLAATWIGAGSFQWMMTRSARLIALTSISGRLMELKCIPGSIQRSKKI